MKLLRYAILAVVLPLHINSFDSQGDRKTSYVYCPGLLGSPIIMGRYCPSFTAPTNEHVTWERGGHVIGHPYSAVTFAEIITEKPRFYYNPLTWPSNGFRCLAYPLAKWIAHKRYGVLVVEDKNNTNTIANYFFSFSAVNIGQIPDIELLNATLITHRQEHPDTDIILYGDSRGAATIINFLGLGYDHTNIKAIVLEGAPDSVDHQLHHYCITRIPGMKKMVQATLSCITSINHQGPFAIMTVAQIPTHIPVLFVTSVNDEIVPHQCSMRLYNALQERPNVHLLVLQKPNHMDYMYHEKDRYESVVHAFYKEYGLAHNAQKAATGASAFAATRPCKEDLRTTYHLTDACCTQ